MFLNSSQLFSLPLLYLDPGSGSFIIQLLLGVGLGAAVVIKMYWIKLKSLITGKKNEVPPSSTDTDEQ